MKNYQRQNSPATSKTFLHVGVYLSLGLISVAALYLSPFLNRTRAEGVSGVAITPGSTTLGAATTYTTSFTAPQAMTTGNSMMLNVFFNGPDDPGARLDLSSATLTSLTANGTAVSGSIQRAEDFQDNMTQVVLGGNVASGATVQFVLAGVTNPTIQGQYSGMVNLQLGGEPGQEGPSGNDNFFLGLGAITKTINGKITYSSNAAAVTDAQVNANQQGGQLFLSTSVDSGGNYTLEVPGGKWEVRVEPQFDQSTGRQKAVDWAFSGQGGIASFANDVTTESATVNLQVIKATATVKGKIIKPDGAPLDGGWVDLRDKDSAGVGGGVNPSDGAFNISVPAGSYRVSVFSQNQSFTAPNLDPFSVADDQTKDLGTITLVEKTSHIKGTVVDQSTGGGVANMNVNTWSPDSGGWGETNTGGDGTFDLLVGLGTWEVMVRPSPDSGYAFEAGPPTRIAIADGQTVSGLAFTVVQANSTINGQVVDVNGNVLSNFFGFAMAMQGSGDPPKPGPGTDAQGGTFSLAVPAGTWTVNVHTEPGSDLSSAGGKTVTLADGASTSVQIVMKQNDASITGTVKDEDGNAVTGVRGEIFAENGKGSFKFDEINQSDGTFSLGVVGGDSWYLGVFVEPGSGYMMLPPSDSKTSVASGETVTKNFTLLKANATIKGKVLDPNGNGLGNVFVFADTNLTDDGSVLGLQTNAANIGGPLGDDLGSQGIHTGDLTAGDGTFTLELPAGTYGLGSGAPSELGYINPEFKTVTVAKDETVTGVTLQYQKSDAQISGSVYLNGSKSEGFVWAWSEKGAHSEAYSRTGDYTLNVTSGDVWHIGADYGANQKFYQSGEFVVDLTNATSASQDLNLVESLFSVPPAVSQSITASAGGTIQLEDGTSLVIPAGAFGSSGTYTVTITPTAQLTKEKNTRPIAFGYEISAVDSNGQAFTSAFNSSVRLIMPYTDEMLAAIGVTEDDIIARFFDTTSAVWQGVDTFTVNKDENTIVASISHFTTFAVTTGTGDTTPPSNPTGVTATAGTGKISLGWTNPTDTDFNHIAIYRSETSGVLGALHTSTTAATTTSYEDTGLDGNKTYYYTLKAVDTVGNMSTGASQISATVIPAATQLPATGVPIASALMFYLTRFLGMAVLLGAPSYLFLRRR